jgi:regulator of protease activity HflC (stomatin/prohibitin superfamily)
MLNKLIDLLIELWEVLNPVFILQPYEQSAVVHFGSIVDVYTGKNGLFGTGVHFKIPLVCELHTDNVVPAVIAFEPQVIMSKDGRPLVVKVVLLWSIKDIKKAQLDIEEVDVMLANGGESVVLKVVNGHTLEEIYQQREKLEKEMLKDIRRRCGKWGIKVHSIEFTHLAEGYILRLVD